MQTLVSLLLSHFFLVTEREGTKCLLQQGKKREEITANKMDLLVKYHEHCGGTICSLNLTIAKIYIDLDFPESDM